MTTSLRALHRAVQQAQNARYFTDWLARPPFREFHPAFRAAVAALGAWPAPESYDHLAGVVPHAGVSRPRFVRQDRALVDAVGGYEEHVARFRAVPTRPSNWHDFFNMSVWAHFPALRWALNQIHVDPTLGPKDPRNGRSRLQNAAAQFDESGMIVTSSSPSLLEELRGLRFKRVFWERRAELQATTHFWLVGHGTLESLLSPHLGLAAKAILLHWPGDPAGEHDESRRLELDQRVAAIVRSWQAGAPAFDPIPVMGIPGYSDDQSASFYDDSRYFRFQRRAPAALP